MLRRYFLRDSAERFTKLGVEVFLGRGKFVDSNSVIVNGKVLRPDVEGAARLVDLAAGGRLLGR